MSTSTSRTAARRSSAAGADCFAAQMFGLTGLGDRTTLSRVHDAPISRSSRPSSSAHEFRLGPEGLEPRRHLHLCLGAADIPDAQHPRARRCSRRSRSVIRSSAARRGRSAARSGMDYRQPGRRSRPRPTDPRPAARRLRCGCGIDAFHANFGSPAFARPSRPGASARLLELRQGLRRPRRDGRLRAGRRQLPRARRRPAEPARGPSRRDRASLHRLWRIPARSRGSPSRSARALNMRGSRCSASRNFRPAITPSAAATIPARCSATGASARRPRCATAAASRRARAAGDRRLCLLGSRVGPQPRPISIVIAGSEHSNSVGARRARQLRPLRARRRVLRSRSPASDRRQSPARPARADLARPPASGHGGTDDRPVAYPLCPVQRGRSARCLLRVAGDRHGALLPAKSARRRPSRARRPRPAGTVAYDRATPGIETITIDQPDRDDQLVAERRQGGGNDQLPARPATRATFTGAPG